MSIITNTVAAGIATVAAVGYVFHDEIIPPPDPPSEIVVCENFFPLPSEAALAVRGCRLDGRTVRVIVANSSELQVP